MFDNTPLGSLWIFYPIIFLFWAAAGFTWFPCYYNRYGELRPTRYIPRYCLLLGLIGPVFHIHPHQPTRDIALLGWYAPVVLVGFLTTLVITRAAALCRQHQYLPGSPGDKVVKQILTKKT